jgi:hypothetical protein
MGEIVTLVVREERVVVGLFLERSSPVGRDPELREVLVADAYGAAGRPM